MPVMLKRPWPLAVFLFAIFILSACNESSQTPTHAQLDEIKRQLSDLNAEHQTLMQRCNRIVERAALLEVERANLEVKADELTEWSRQLADRFGPGIWYFSTAERPLPIKSIRDATPEVVVKELNRRFVQDKLPPVVLEKIAGNVAHVTIGDEQQLTQHMGTTGATAFIEVVTYSLTSLESIDFVEFKFKEGDHAIPGRYSR